MLTHHHPNDLTITRTVPPDKLYPALRDRLTKAAALTPVGEFHVDADALRRARAQTPSGEFHSP